MAQNGLIYSVKLDGYGVLCTQQFFGEGPGKAATGQKFQWADVPGCDNPGEAALVLRCLTSSTLLGGAMIIIAGAGLVRSSAGKTA